MTDRDTYPEGADLLPIGEVARRLGVSVDTIRRWDKAGKITAIRTPTGHRRFHVAEVDRLLGTAA